VSELSSSISKVRRAIKDIDPPASLFAGIRLSLSFAPDNIIFFKRTHTSALAPEGVSNNFHHRFELVVVLDRGGPVRVGNGTHALRPGESVLIFPNQFHHYLDVEKGELEWLFITFRCTESSLLNALRDSPRVLDKECMDLLARISELYVKQVKPGPGTLFIAHDLGRILLRMRDLPTIPRDRLNAYSTDDSRDVLLEKINAYVRDNLNRKLTLEELARELGYSASHMRAVFRDRLGVSLGRYIRESQLSEAAKLLQRTNLNVTEIAERTSFNSLFAFSRAFKAAYGMSPKAYSKTFGQDVSR